MKTLLYFHPVGSTSWRPIVDGVKDIALKANWHVQEVNVPPTHHNLDELCQFWNPVGVIIDAGAGFGGISPADLKLRPTVLIDPDPTLLPSGTYSVRHDSVATATLAAKELLSTGFSHFAYVPYPKKRFWSTERETAFAKSVEINGGTCRVFRTRNTSNSDSPDYLRRLREFIAALPKPCGIFAANDHTAAKVLTTARLLELSVPDDIAVIGVDNYVNICEDAFPSLSSIEPDYYHAGTAAAMLMMEIVHAGNRRKTLRKRTFGPVRIVRRASTRILKNHDADVESALELIQKESCVGLTAARVTKLFACSRVYAEMRFRKATGQSILEAIHTVRLERAKALLRNPSQQLKSIADFCGFKSQNALCKFFLKKTGRTMSAWRSATAKDSALAFAAKAKTASAAMPS